MNDEEPIFKFDGLKECLTSMGYQLEKAKPWVPITGQDVGIEMFTSGDITFNNEGGINLNVDGVKHIGFLYKREYRLADHGKPRMHICKCKTINEFIELGSFEVEYRFAETEKVMVVDKNDGNIDKEINDLPLCKNCINLLQGPKFKMVNGSKDFAKLIEKINNYANEQKHNEDKEKDIFGYTKNWENISRAYRELKEYTCEKCGIQITNPFDYHFMHVHHINANKTDNRKDNLQCLCVACHANIDDIHRENFSKGGNKTILRLFKELYK